MDSRCKSCCYNTPKTRGGRGRICNGSTMKDHSRCPEWVINEYGRNHSPRTLVMSELVESNKV